MFDDTLGVYPHKMVHIDIDPNAKPVHSRPYPVPQIHLKTFKKKLNHLVRIDVLAAQHKSEWASPSFIIPKKDSRVRWVSNLRQLNKVIRCKQYPLLIITDILCKRSECTFFTKLDASMQYNTFELDEERQDLCTIITPFGKYKYLRLPMGLKCSPDIAQAAIENVLSDIEYANIYIDDVGVFSNDWDHHVNMLATILWQLRENGFTINPLKAVIFFRPIEFAKEHLRTGALGRHLLYFCIYLRNFVAVLHFQMRKTNTIELQYTIC
jgi:hypothetical protein